QFEFGTNHDYRAARIIDSLAEQVLAEPALLALQHIGQGLQGPLVGPRNYAAAPAAVEQRIDRLLQHAFFVAHDDVWGTQLDEPLQPVVAVDYPAVKVVQIGGRKAPTVERHERPQFRRNDRDDLQDHPFGPAVGFDKGLDQ